MSAQLFRLPMFICALYLLQHCEAIPKNSPVVTVHGPSIIQASHSVDVKSLSGLNSALSSTNTDKALVVPLWPCGDKLDYSIMELVLPLLAIFIILPIGSSFNAFWLVTK